MTRKHYHIGWNEEAGTASVTMRQHLRHLLFLLDHKTKRQMWGVFVLMLLAAVLEMIGIGLVIPMLKIITDPGRVSEMAVIGPIYERFTPGNPRLFLVWFTAGLALFYLVRNTAVLLVLYVQNRFVMRRQAEHLVKLLEFYLQRPYSFHLQRNSAELMRNLESAMPAVFISGLLPLLSLGLEICLGLGILTVLFFVEPVGTLLAGLVLGGASISLYRSLGPSQKHWGDRQQYHAGQIFQWIHQGLGANKEARVMGREPFFRDHFAKHCHSRARYQILTQTVAQLPRLVFESVLILAILLIVAAVVFVQDLPLESVVTTLGVFSVGAFRLMPSANRAVLAAGSLKIGTAAVDLLYRDFKAQAFHEYQEHQAGPGPVTPLPFEREIRLENLSYHYPAAREPALRGIDLSIAKGQTVALVGPSGAGKTTFVDIFLGLLEPSEGRLTIDGADVADNARAWQAHLGYVPQMIYILDDTLRHNIAFGLPDDAIDEKRLAEAIRLAHLEQVVAQLPNREDTLLGEHGIRLSGGQRQRIGIARALYNDPDVLVLDEATAALDNETEREVTRAIDELADKKTLIVIAHRLSTVRHCDQVVYIQSGRVVDVGSFDDLLARNADFRRFAQTGKMAEPGLDVPGEGR